MSNTPKDNSIAEQYSKEYKKYQRRISEAQKSGIDIPEKFIIPKVKRPTMASIERIQRVTRQAIIQDIKRTEYEDKRIAARRGYYAINPETGETIRHQNKLPEFYDISRVEIDEIRTARPRTDPNRPLSLHEVLDISNKVKEERQSVPYQLDENEITDIVFSRIAELRGPEFKEEAFLAQEEKYKGYTTRDASRRLDKEEREYVQSVLKEADEKGENLDYGDVVSSMRSFLPDFDIRDQILEEEEQEHPAYMDFKPKSKSEQNIPSEDGYAGTTNPKDFNDKGQDNVSHDSEYTYIYDTIMDTLETLVFKSKYAQVNLEYAINRLKSLANGTSKQAVSFALQTLYHPEKGVGLFDFDLMYKRNELDGFIDSIVSLAVAFNDAENRGENLNDIMAEDAIRTEYENGEDYLQ